MTVATAPAPTRFAPRTQAEVKRGIARRYAAERRFRLYGIAAKMLNMLGYRSVRLLTNNPAKVAALKAAGIKVVERVAHAFPDNDHNRAYLKTKAEKAGHLL